MAPSRTARRSPSRTAPDPIVLADEPVVTRSDIEIKASRERIDVVLRFCQEDDPFVVDWAPPQS